eukprot:m.64021 g.64021  ORF g.64021 m.64021 type:complete len:473 (-) comp23384_c0_seq1:571-1989(-)
MTTCRIANGVGEHRPHELLQEMEAKAKAEGKTIHPMFLKAPQHPEIMAMDQPWRSNFGLDGTRSFPRINSGTKIAKHQPLGYEPGGPVHTSPGRLSRSSSPTHTKKSSWSASSPTVQSIDRTRSRHAADNIRLKLAEEALRDEMLNDELAKVDLSDLTKAQVEGYKRQLRQHIRGLLKDYKEEYQEKLTPNSSFIGDTSMSSTPGRSSRQTSSNRISIAIPEVYDSGRFDLDSSPRFASPVRPGSVIQQRRQQQSQHLKEFPLQIPKIEFPDGGSRNSESPLSNAPHTPNNNVSNNNNHNSNMNNSQTKNIRNQNTSVMDIQDLDNSRSNTSTTTKSPRVSPTAHSNRTPSQNERLEMEKKIKADQETLEQIMRQNQELAQDLEEFKTKSVHNLDDRQKNVTKVQDELEAMTTSFRSAPPENASEAEVRLSDIGDKLQEESSEVKEYAESVLATKNLLNASDLPEDSQEIAF